MSVVKPGRTPISIVTNEMSKRRTLAQLAFIEGDRLLGEEAAALAVRYPDRVYARHAAKPNTANLDGRHACTAMRLRLPYQCANPIGSWHVQRSRMACNTCLCRFMSSSELLRTADYVQILRATSSAQWHDCLKLTLIRRARVHMLMRRSLCAGQGIWLGSWHCTMM